MNRHFRPFLAMKLYLFFFLLFIFGCGSKTSPPGTLDASLSQCSPDTAQILVGDGFFQISCGCTGANETTGTVFSAPGGLTCHLPSSKSRVFFNYIGTVLRHQIVSIGEPEFTSSGISDPSSSQPLRYHSTVFDIPASVYDFEDSISGMTGQIIVP